MAARTLHDPEIPLPRQIVEGVYVTLSGATIAVFIAALQQVNSWLTFVALLAAAMTGCGLVWAKVIKPVAEFIRRVYVAIDHLQDMREVQSEIIARIENIEGQIAPERRRVHHHRPLDP